jgi:hypothetical protein
MTRKADVPAIPSNTETLVADLRRMIDETRSAVAVTVNAGLTFLYWRVGSRINAEILNGGRTDYGKKILATVSQTLSWSHFKELLSLNRPLQREF